MKPTRGLIQIFCVSLQPQCEDLTRKSARFHHNVETNG